MNYEHSVRVTNVYEENPLVIYEDNSMQTDPENSLDSAENRAALWAQRLMRHVRRQLSFGPSHNPLRSLLEHCLTSSLARYLVAGPVALAAMYN